jgi:hypothetical protein
MNSWFVGSSPEGARQLGMTGSHFKSTGDLPRLAILGTRFQGFRSGNDRPINPGRCPGLGSPGPSGL